MSNASIRAFFDPLRSVGFASLTSSYTPIGSAPTNPLRVILFQNATDTSIMFSFNGTDDHLFLPPSGFFVVDLTTNKNTDAGFFLFAGAPLLVKDTGTPATSGAVYISAVYGVPVAGI
jgi:hypothetical protein